MVNFCDYFVLCSGNSDRQVRAIARGVEEGLEKEGMRVYLKQGSQDAHWILLDLGSVVIHVFDPETREFYGLEYIWQEAKQIPWEENPAPRKV